jgi:hypothetical protein
VGAIVSATAVAVIAIREGYESGAPSGDSIEERFSILGSDILKHLLAGDNIDFTRPAVADARHFPDLARVARVIRERGAQNAAGVFKEVTKSKQRRDLNLSRNRTARY